jgi:ureidoglycolate dehydrogenase (NAD+)/(2R)-3-sulfolactate dehydrogenase (NADP+)
MSGLLVSAADLEDFVKEVFLSRSMTKEGAEAIASALLWAELRDIGTHGVTRLPRYLDMIEQGDMNPRPTISVVAEGPAFVVIEADRAAGPLAMSMGTDVAVERAKRSGVGVAFVRATTHTAALGFYAERAARFGTVCLAMAASGPTMAYHGARTAAVSTSPISIAAPSGTDDPIVFDMSTGIVSLGKLAAAAKDSRLLGEGWALDRKGMPTIDPKTAAIPRPVGGPKGSGLALMIEIVVSLLATNPILAGSIQQREGARRHKQNGLVIAFDIAHFSDPVIFAAEVGGLAGVIRSLAPADDDQPVRLPGDRAWKVSRERQARGIPLSASVVAQLQAVAFDTGIRRGGLPPTERSQGSAVDQPVS